MVRGLCGNQVKKGVFGASETFWCEENEATYVKALG